MRTLLPVNLGRNSYILSLFYSFLFLLALPLSAQDYESISDGDWENGNTWDCIGPDGPCNRNPFPSTRVTGTVTISHDVTYFSNSPIEIRNNGELFVNGSTFDNRSNLNINSGGSVELNNAILIIGPGVLNMDGELIATNSLIEKDGNYVNDGLSALFSSCVTITSGNFNNFGTVSGNGGVKVLSGNLNNNGTWSSDLLYYYSNNGSNLPGSISTLEEVDNACACALSNVGDTAPILTAETPTEFCEGDTLLPFSSYQGSTAPGGTAFTWSINPDPLVLGDHVAADQIPTAGTTYYGFFYDTDNNCASPVVTLNITVNPDATASAGE
ncbi:MAG: hypothetical protein P8X60_10600, partial [Robiginitalea sp.]